MYVHILCNIYFYILLIYVPGQGCKACPYADMDEACKPHQAVTREDLEFCVTQQQQPQSTSAQQALFEKTLSLYHVYKVHSCLGPTDAPAKEDTNQDEWTLQNEKAHCGQQAKLTCRGRLLFDYDHTGKAFVRCITLDP